MKNTIPALAGLFLFTSLLATQAADEPIVTAYYPLKIGTRWQYKVGGNSLTVKVTKHEKVGDLNCAVLETSRDDQVVATEHVGIKADGVFRYSLGAIKPDPPFRILKLPPKNGDSWDIQSKVGGETLSGKFTLKETEVTVPAGKYKALLAVSDGFTVPDPKGNKIKLVFKFWFAEKVGMVKQTFQVGDAPEVVIELEKMELP
jgi:hypothetical protein